jgi:UDP-N-acetylglucosamine--N-acetylmuramyl-(pentapeptide) pyrophosphoryl-undecaprenol N-acetylglucosamine transferase
VRGLGIAARPAVPSAELAAAIADADLLIAHAGAGIALTAFDLGRSPLLVPRRPEHDEHVDDHQQQIAGALATRGLATVCEADGLTWEDIERAASVRVAGDEHPPPLALARRRRSDPPSSSPA